MTIADRPRMTLAEARQIIEGDPALWASTVFGKHMRHQGGPLIPWAPYQRELWEFLWKVKAGELPVVDGRRVSTFAAIWSRSFAKTTNGQMGIGALAARARRRYGIVVSATQDKANEKVEGVGSMLTSRDFRKIYPDVGARAVRQYGKGAWRRDRIQTLSGFTLDGYGLEAYVRGAKIDDEDESLRPDLIVLDDIDEDHDSAYETQRKVETITKGILAAGVPGNTLVVVLQNVILAGGFVDQLATSADFLTDRIVSGPHPAVQGMAIASEVTPEGRTRWYFTAGTSTWPEGRPMADLQGELDQVGPTAFRSELQHDVRAASPLVYPQFRPAYHRWRRATRTVDGDGSATMTPLLPRFKGFAGGLDFGGEGATAHLSAGAVVGVVDGGRRGEDLYVLVDEFGDNGIRIGARQMEWMEAMGRKWGPIAWRGDGSQATAMMWAAVAGFDGKPGDRELASAEDRRRRLGDWLVPAGIDPALPPELWATNRPPRFRYLPRCVKFEGEMLRYRRQLPKSDEQPSRREVVKVHDDVIDAVLQACEEAARGVWLTSDQAYAYGSVRMG